MSDLVANTSIITICLVKKKLGIHMKPERLETMMMIFIEQELEP